MKVVMISAAVLVAAFLIWKFMKKETFAQMSVIRPNEVHDDTKTWDRANFRSSVLPGPTLYV